MNEIHLQIIIILHMYEMFPREIKVSWGLNRGELACRLGREGSSGDAS